MAPSGPRTRASADLGALTERLYRRALERYGDRAGELTAVRLLEDEAGTTLRFSDGSGPAHPRRS